MPAEKILSESQNDTGQVQRQVKLPFLKSVEISIKSIKVPDSSGHSSPP